MDNLDFDKSTTMDTRVLAIVGSINFQESKHEDLPLLLKELTNKIDNCSWVENYYMIAHNDTDTPHIHYIFELSGQIRIKTCLNHIEKLGYNRSSINIGKLGFLNSSLRYFLHLTEDSKNDGKKEYEIGCIVSNMPYEVVENYVNVEDDNINVDRLVQICLEYGNNQVAIMRRLGLKTFHKWRYEIKLICDNDYYARLERDMKREKRLDDNLPY